jgi:putative hydrolase of the HAD superfamily
MQNSSGSTDNRDRPPSISLPKISAVILDYGQVLARSATREDFGPMAEMLNVSFEEFFKLWEATRDIYDRGDVTPEDYWLQLAEQTNSSIDSSQIKTLRKLEVEIWVHFDPDMIAWVSQLRAAGVKTGLLSNMPCDLVKYLRANCGWIQNFSFQTFSAEVRLIKPDPAIYKHTLLGLGVPAAEVLFIDDRKVNIEAARALGIHAIQFHSTAQLRDDLDGLGFPVLPSVTESAVGGNSSDQAPRESKFSALL